MRADLLSVSAIPRLLRAIPLLIVLVIFSLLGLTGSDARANLIANGDFSSCGGSVGTNFAMTGTPVWTSSSGFACAGSSFGFTNILYECGGDITTQTFSDTAGAS
jgi:hypothetical protein